VAVEVTVILDGTAGGMARVIAALKRLGLTFSGHRIEPLDDTRSRLTVKAEGEAAAARLREEIARIKGVAEVVQIGSDEESSAVRHDAAARPTAPTGRLEDFADRLVKDYPRILAHIDAFEQALPADRDAGQQFWRLGRRVGTKLGGQDPTLRQAETLDEALENSVVPVLGGVAEPEVVDGDIRLRVSIFTRGQGNAIEPASSSAASRCEFLSGVIEGLLDGAPGIPDVQVREIRCRNRGDEYCLFRMSG